MWTWQLDDNERKTKALYEQIDQINDTLEEDEDILKTLHDLHPTDEKKDSLKEDEINGNEQHPDEKYSSEDLNKHVDQISVSLIMAPQAVVFDDVISSVIIESLYFYLVNLRSNYFEMFWFWSTYLTTL